jgi:hypothetical protein
MEDKKIPYIVHEASMARYERKERRLWITLLILLGVLGGSNLFWIIYFFG